MQDVTILNIDQSLSAESALKNAIRQLNAQGRRVLSIAYANFEYVILHEPDERKVGDTAQEKPADVQASIRANPDILTLSPGESRPVLVLFEHMPPCKLQYRTLNPEGGTIDAEGVYTAPQYSGVFEIEVWCTDAPEIKTNVFAAVK